jgi:hypothetical protein
MIMANRFERTPIPRAVTVVAATTHDSSAQGVGWGQGDEENRDGRSRVSSEAVSHLTPGSDSIRTWLSTNRPGFIRDTRGYAFFWTDLIIGLVDTTPGLSKQPRQYSSRSQVIDKSHAVDECVVGRHDGDNVDALSKRRFNPPSSCETASQIEKPHLSS